MKDIFDVETISEKFNNDSSEEEIFEFVESIKSCPSEKEKLVTLLAERNKFYKDKGANQVIRIRGYIMATFEQVGLPDSALSFVLDELENSRSAYLIAAAAKALRGQKSPSIDVVQYLVKAIFNIRYNDDAITFEIYKPQWPLENYTTALNEILITFQWLGSYAKDAASELKKLMEGNILSSEIKTKIQKTIELIQTDERKISKSCCHSSILETNTISKTKVIKIDFESLSDIQMEDQDSECINFTKFFKSVPSVVTFFYTRCDNPNKCSLTVTKMGQLQRALITDGIENRVRTALITYDPGYDNADRLNWYGKSRGFNFNKNNRAFRIEKDNFVKIQDYFELGVNYNGSIVNQHRVELYILNKNGRIIHSFVRLQWNIGEVIEVVKKFLT